MHKRRFGIVAALLLVTSLAAPSARANGRFPTAAVAPRVGSSLML